MGLVQFPQNTTGVLAGAMRGAGYTEVPMMVAGVGLWGVRVPLALLMTYVQANDHSHMGGNVCRSCVQVLCLFLLL
jgi:Na+-driven multidrug efflux pump